MKKGIFLLVLVIITIAACKTKKETAKTEGNGKTENPVVKREETTVTPNLNCGSTDSPFASVKSIFDKHCVTCHGYGGDGGYNFLVMNDIKRAAEKGELLGTIKWHRGFPKMPAQADQLDNVSINLIECWIANGMKE